MKSDEELQKRLRWDHLDSKLISSWLDHNKHKSAGNPENKRPDWYLRFTAACSIIRQKWNISIVKTPLSQNLAFFDIWYPLGEWAISLLEKNARDIDLTLNIEQQAYLGLVESLYERLCKVTEQVLWCDFQSGISPGSFLIAHLSRSAIRNNSIDNDRYRQFIERHRADGLDSLIKTYPVIARLIGTVIHNWIESNVELLSRLASDFNEVAKAFELPKSLTVADIKPGKGDFHNNGRSTTEITFTDSICHHDSKKYKLMYKPRSLELDAAFQCVLRDLNSNSDLQELKTSKILLRDGYGYMEFIDHRVSRDSVELQRFYHNAGRLCAILHVFGCTDCHFENLVSIGDQLALIDAETLFEPETLLYQSEKSNGEEIEMASWLRQRFKSSVMRTGLLPRWQIYGKERIATDISALGMSPPPANTYKVYGWIAINTDGMLPGFVDRVSEVPISLPVGIGMRNPFHSYVDKFCDGYRIQCQDLIRIRKDWLSTGGILERFADLERRIVVRATGVYTAIQKHQLKPDALRSAFSQSIQLEQLCSGFLLENAKPSWWSLFLSEVEQMNSLDIPLFTHSVDSTSIQAGNSADLKGAIKKDGLSLVRDRLQSLDQNEIDFQICLIRGCMGSRIPVHLSHKQVNKAGTDYSNLNALQTIENSNPCLISGESAVQRLSNLLIDIGIKDHSGDIDWLGMDLIADSQMFKFGPIDSSLYGGGIGIACFLSALACSNFALSSEHRYQVSQAIQSILKPLKRLASSDSDANRMRWWRDQQPGLSGSAGTILALQSLGENKLAGILLESCEPQWIDRDYALDIMSGASGLIGCLLESGSTSCFNMAEYAGDLLCHQQCDDGSWKNPRLSKHGLLGFSHGAAGSLAALAKLFSISGIKKYRDAVINALNYERQFFAQSGTWPDLRTGGNGVMRAWCHGAPGIALSRACMWGTDLWDKIMQDEVNAALLETSKARPGYDHLCCGKSGLLVIMRALIEGPWEIYDDVMESCKHAIKVHEANLLARCGETPIELAFFNTKDSTIYVPGLFNGISGVGLVLMNTLESRQITIRLLSAGLFPVNAGIL